MATLKEIRKFVGLTQKELAERAGINIRQVQKYESGEYSLDNMTAKTALGISEALGCTIDELLSLDLSIFTEDAKESARDGVLTVSELVSMDKYQKVMRHSKIGKFGDTFRRNYERIPEDLLEKLTSEELAALVDAFYDCYSDGRNSNS